MYSESLCKIYRSIYSLLEWYYYVLRLIKIEYDKQLTAFEYAEGLSRKWEDRSIRESDWWARTKKHTEKHSAGYNIIIIQPILKNAG